MGNFYTDVIQKSLAFNSDKLCNDMELLEPTTYAKVQIIIVQASLQYGIELRAFETYRSQQRQLALYRSGATLLRNVGVHHFGLACDLVVYTDGQPTWKADYTFLGALAAEAGMVWGGDWAAPGVRHSFQDSDHVQRIAVADQQRLFNGLWYPDVNYSAKEVG